MRYIILMLTAIFCQNIAAETTKISDNKVDLTVDVKLALQPISVSINEGVYYHQLVEREGRVNLIYNGLDSLYFLSMKSAVEFDRCIDRRVSQSQLPQNVSFTYLPRRRFDVIFATSNSGKLTHSHSLDDGENWIEPIESDIYATSPAQLSYRRNFSDIQIYMWGRGDLTSLNSGDRSMLFSLTSSNGGNSWHTPEIALKHNLYSLDAGALGLYRKRRGRHVLRNKGDIIYAIAIDSLSGKTFVSNSSESSKFSYPSRYSTLDNTYRHNILIYKHTGAILYIKRAVESGNYELWVNAARLDRLSKETGRARRHFKLFSFREDEDINEFCFDGYLYRHNQLILTLARKWEDGENSIKYANITLNKYN